MPPYVHKACSLLCVFGTFVEWRLQWLLVIFGELWPAIIDVALVKRSFLMKRCRSVSVFHASFLSALLTDGAPIQSLTEWTCVEDFLLEFTAWFSAPRFVVILYSKSHELLFKRNYLLDIDVLGFTILQSFTIAIYKRRRSFFYNTVLYDQSRQLLEFTSFIFET